MKFERPVRGLLPRWLWLELLEVPAQPSTNENNEREMAIRKAIERYQAAGLMPPQAWIAELLLV